MTFYKLVKHNKGMMENEHTSYHSTVVKAMNKAEDLGLKSREWVSDETTWEADDEESDYTWLVFSCPLED